MQQLANERDWCEMSGEYGLTASRYTTTEKWHTHKMESIQSVIKKIQARNT